MASRSTLIQAGIQQRTDHISDRVKQINISPIKEIALLASTRTDIIPFAWGVPHVVTPKHIRAALQTALDSDPTIGQYSPSLGLPALRQAAAAQLQQRFGINVDPNQELVVSAGAMEMLLVALQTVVNPDDEVIVTDPSFASYQEQIVLAGGKPVFWELDEERGWQPDAAQLAGLITPRTKAIMLCSPNNPTGTIFSQADLDVVADLVLKHNLILITDEPYHFLTYEQAHCPNLVSDERLRYNRISCFSLSKEYAMTGYRVGYVLADPGMIRQLLKIHDNNVVSAPRPSQVAAIAALTGDQRCVGELRDILRQRRDLMCAALDEMSPWVSYVKPEGSYYILVKMKPEVDDVQLAVDLLNEAKIAVVPGSGFGPSGKGHLRFCFGCTEELITEGMKRFKHYLQTHY